MNSFELFAIARSGMDQQQRRIEFLAHGMVANSSVGQKAAGQQPFSAHLQRGGAETPTPAETENMPDAPLSYVTTVTDLMDAMRLYQMNITMANAAKTMIERSLEISAK